MNNRNVMTLQKRVKTVCFLVILLNCSWTSTPYCVANQNRVIKVGAGFPILKPSSAASIAVDGDTIEILAGTYRGDVAVWRQNNLDTWHLWQSSY